jgi:hypothetical protein
MRKYFTVFLFTAILPAIYCQNTSNLMKQIADTGTDKQEAPDRNDRNNNFYDNEETYVLKPVELEISGEVSNPGKVDFSGLEKRSVIVKETLLKEDGSNEFVGAYRYDGYSLFDILNDRRLKKNNEAEFRPVIDVFVEIRNNRGEKAVISWGEIYYPNFLHNIIIATSVMRIVPGKTKDLWPLPTECKLIIGNDLITERNISSLTRIIVRSYPRSYDINRELNPLYSYDVKIYNGEKQIRTLTELPQTFQEETLHTIFYGKGRGIHSTQPFTGIYLKDFLAAEIPVSQKNIREGLVLLVGMDGYRSVYTMSEIMNRNDQAEVLVVPCPGEKDGGKFRIFPSADFFSDRAVKALSEIRFDLIENP